MRMVDAKRHLNYIVAGNTNFSFHKINFGILSLPDIAAWSLIRVLELVKNCWKIWLDLISCQNRSSLDRVTIELDREKHVPEAIVILSYLFIRVHTMLELETTIRNREKPLTFHDKKNFKQTELHVPYRGLIEGDCEKLKHDCVACPRIVVLKSGRVDVVFGEI